MAEDGSNGQEGAAPPQPGVSVIAQYVKDLSYENPGAPATLTQQGGSPNISVSVGVQPRPVSDTDIEIELRLDARAIDGETTLFAIELVYAGVFRLINVTQETVNPIMLIECPRLLFPFARRIIADASRDGGFPPLLLDPIDFVALYRQRMVNPGAAAPAAEAPPSTN
jgi:preprotein translocase subunit SecB